MSVRRPVRPPPTVNAQPIPRAGTRPPHNDFSEAPPEQVPSYGHQNAYRDEEPSNRFEQVRGGAARPEVDPPEDFDAAVREEMARLEEAVRRQLYVETGGDHQGLRVQTPPELHRIASGAPPSSYLQGLDEIVRRETDRQNSAPHPIQPLMNPNPSSPAPKPAPEPETSLPWHRQTQDKRTAQAQYRAALDQQVQSNRLLDTANNTPPAPIAAQENRQKQPLTPQRIQPQSPLYQQQLRQQRYESPHVYPPPQPHVEHTHVQQRSSYPPSPGRSFQPQTPPRRQAPPDVDVGPLPVPTDEQNRWELRQKQQLQANALNQQIAEKQFLDSQDSNPARRNSRFRAHDADEPYTRTQNVVGHGNAESEGFLDGFGKQDPRAKAAKERAERALATSKHVRQRDGGEVHRSPRSQRTAHSPISSVRGPDQITTPTGHPAYSPQHFEDDDYVDGPFGPRRRGGGGEPTRNNDLRVRHGQLQASPSPKHSQNGSTPRQVFTYQDTYPPPSQSPVERGCNEGRRSARSPPPAAVQQVDPTVARRRQAMELQRQALEQQMEEKKFLQQQEEHKRREEDEADFRRWAEAQKRLEAVRRQEAELKAAEQARNDLALQELQRKEQMEALQRQHRRPAATTQNYPEETAEQQQHQYQHQQPHEQDETASHFSGSGQGYGHPVQDGNLAARHPHAYSHPGFAHPPPSRNYSVQAYESVFNDDFAYQNQGYPAPYLAPPAAPRVYRQVYQYAPYATEAPPLMQPPLPGQYAFPQENLPYPPDPRYYASVRQPQPPYVGQHRQPDTVDDFVQHWQHQHPSSNPVDESFFSESQFIPATPQQPQQGYRIPREVAHADGEPSLVSHSLLLHLKNASSPRSLGYREHAAPMTQRGGVPPSSPLATLVQSMAHVTGGQEDHSREHHDYLFEQEDSQHSRRSDMFSGSYTGSARQPQPSALHTRPTFSAHRAADSSFDTSHQYRLSEEQPIRSQHRNVTLDDSNTLADHSLGEFNNEEEEELIVVPSNKGYSHFPTETRPATTQHFAVQRPSEDQQRALLSSRGGVNEERKIQSQDAPRQRAQWDLDSREETIKLLRQQHQSSSFD